MSFDDYGVNLAPSLHIFSIELHETFVILARIGIGIKEVLEFLRHYTVHILFSIILPFRFLSKLE